MPIFARLAAIVADRHVARHVGHVVVDPAVPAHLEQRVEVAETGRRAADAVEPRPEWHAADRAGHRSRQGGTGVAVDGQQARRRLAAENRRREHIARNQQAGVARAVDVGGGVPDALTGMLPI